LNKLKAIHAGHTDIYHEDIAWIYTEYLHGFDGILERSGDMNVAEEIFNDAFGGLQAQGVIIK
jgi:hypothetical protein